MRATLTRILMLLIFTAVIALNLQAQDYLTGKMSDAKGVEHAVFYDRTQRDSGISIYQSVYKVISTNKVPLYSITLTHDALKAIVYITLKKEKGEAQEILVKYDPHASGLVFSDKGAIDTAFNMADKYGYLLSFADAERDYPVLHKIVIENAQQLQLDPLTKLRLKRNAEMVRAKTPVEPVAAVAELKYDSFSNQLLQMRDSLYSKSAVYYEAIAEIRDSIQTDVQHYFGDNKVTENESRYGGQMKKGKPDGRGLLADGNTIFDGMFVAGLLYSGNAVVKKDMEEYYGQYSGGAMSGTGWLKYKNGSFFLGVFGNGNLEAGIALAKEANGEVYFGTYKNSQRTGYGELRNPQGNCYYGEFEEGCLVKGYAKEVDQFGYATYTRIDKGTKKTIEPKEASEFFDTNFYAKK